MRKLLLLGFLILFLLGCNDLEQTPELGDVPVENAITISGDENLTIIEIQASLVDEEWQFPLEKYPEQFIDVNLHSEGFIKLDDSHIGFLDENEAIWLTPMIANNTGVLFNAIYSNELPECDLDTIKILGKVYAISELRHESSFKNNNKWKVLHDYEGNCLERIIIYMDGYFYDIENNEQINLFRNDNTIIIQFIGLDEEPIVKIIATKPMN